MKPARLSPMDVVRVGASGLRSRPLRVFLSALGIAIGIAAMLAVVGISTSSRAELDRTLDKLGTNLLTVGPGQTFFGEESHLPEEAIGMIDRIAPVESVSATGNLDSASGAAVMALLHDLHGSGTTVVVITHDRDIAASLPRRVELLDGRIVGDR